MDDSDIDAGRVPKFDLNPLPGYHEKAKARKKQDATSCWTCNDPPKASRPSKHSRLDGQPSPSKNPNDQARLVPGAPQVSAQMQRKLHKKYDEMRNSI